MNLTNIGRIRVVVPAPDLMECVCVCPRCGKRARYGDMYMYFGQNGCGKCIDGLRAEIDSDRGGNYGRYVRKANAHLYEPYKYEGESE